MKQPNLRVRVALWLLLPLLLLLAFDAWLTYQRAMNAAHDAFDRTLEFSLRSIRDGIRLRDGDIEVDLPYLALEMFESNGGGNIYYQIREEGGRVVTGYPDLPNPRKLPAEPYSVQFYDDEFRGGRCASPCSGCPCTMCRARRRGSCWCGSAKRSNRARRWRVRF